MPNLNIRKIPEMEYHQAYQLFRSGKACYVMARTSLETSMSYFTPGFMLMYQAIENLLKALLKKNNIWRSNNKGHNFIILLQKGQADIPLFGTFLNRPDFCELLNELHEGYTAHRYGESGYGVMDMDEMMDSFDKMIFLLIEEFGRQTGLTGEKLEREMALPVSPFLETKFMRKLKQPFIILNIEAFEFGYNLT